MRWILLLSFVPVVLCTDRCFVTNDATLSAQPQEGLQTVDNQVAGKFILNIHQTFPLTYKPNEPIEVTLNAQDPDLRIREFIVVARVPCDTCDTLPPLGVWNLGPSTDFSLADHCSGDSMAFEGRGDALSANVVWTPPATDNTVEFAATVIASDGQVYQHIRSPFVMAYLLTPAGREEAGNNEDVHSDPREFEEGDRTHGEDEEGARGGDFEEEEEEEGPYEDPNEEERYEEEMREESLRRDREGGETEGDGEGDDHGARAEEEMKRREEEKRRQQLRDEDEASEDGWLHDKLNEMEEEEEQFQNELMEYEREMAEEEKRRMERIRWEIRDKEEHDRMMAEEERERDRNDTPKDNYLETDDEEISVKDERIALPAAAGTLSANFAMLIAAAILKFLF